MVLGDYTHLLTALCSSSSCLTRWRLIPPLCLAYINLHRLLLKISRFQLCLIHHSCRYPRSIVHWAGLHSRSIIICNVTLNVVRLFSIIQVLLRLAKKIDGVGFSVNVTLSAQSAFLFTSTCKQVANKGLLTWPKGAESSNQISRGCLLASILW